MITVDKTYDPKLHEEKIYTLWEKGGYFTPKIDKNKKPFTIIMPPPNANDPLHIGHARFVAVEDVLIRYHRMKGDSTLWLPGADHAGIETQFVFEKRLKEDGKSRFDFDQNTLYQMIWKYVQENKKTMEGQLRILGASCDWTRGKFTLDPDIVKIVYKTFKKLYDNGLVYKGNKLVNYCTYCGTAYSELEVDRVEKNIPLYYVKYSNADGEFITVATTRPETIFADTHLAVNPKDKKRGKLIGTKVLNPLTNEEMEIIGDEFVDPEFGTGIVKLTPAHDFNDFEAAQKHDLPFIVAINQDGKITTIGKKYAGLTVKKAREEVVKDLQEKGSIEKIDENYKTVVGVCYRCKNTIEPMLSTQWFLKVEPLVKTAREAVISGKIKFAAQRFEKTYLHWLDILRDWNISRQIVWGIRMPVWYCSACSQTIVTDGEKPEFCSNCQSADLEQESYTFDTWFSSGQWPFATLQTTQPGDFEYFYPTSVMETAYDILPFWVMRMIMLGLYATGEVPFKEVLIHGLVRDKQGQKISKSKGNVIDPIVMAEKYGSDALRMGIVWGALVENDISLSEDNIRAQRNFANKIWNVARYITTQSIEPRAKSIEKSKDTSKQDDAWIKEELGKTIERTTVLLEDYRLNEAAEEIYDFVWHKLADVYLEKTKDRQSEAQPTLLFALQESLKLLHPFMPFVTETIWQTLKETKGVEGFFEEEALIVAKWPEVV
ncbi:MAG TPA: valine--tRNA ligase [Candidatus Blackburnbacteria bacterium]|nr:valine--tRNA ligase [Candidatus Blackburnbacteria bacterium]